MGGGHQPHTGHGEGSGVLETALPAVVTLLCVCGYLRLAHRARLRNPARGWNRWRSASFGTGAVLAAVALLPPLAPFAHADFRGHMAQHLLIGMYAPLALVLGAPVTLLLRNLPAAHGRRLTTALHSRPARLLTHPATALLLASGSLVALYFTPLYRAATAWPPGHWLLHVHFLLSGCLFAHVIAGPDPAARRPGVPVRLVWLGCAIALHAGVSQLMYGGFGIDIAAPAVEVRGAAEIMYYGGDIAELLLAGALVATWRPARHRTPVSAPSPGHA
ncbi:cytochrome c oxidase assembly protein [Streptomyces sp. NPDC021212]|uniref:cytochrome c oxidase assembly protein n=1 Tax=Streptomyces sp. NPDC021212 TaxID=3365118 RepID=UPI0037A7B873